jgi:phosphotransferase system enzyme I (PtsP)
MNARLLSLVDESEESMQRSTAELAQHGIRVSGDRTRAPTTTSSSAGSARRAGSRSDRSTGWRTRSTSPCSSTRRGPSADAEESDLLQALTVVRRDLDDNREELGDRFGPDFSAVFHTHIQILEDKGFVAKLRKAVHETGNARSALVEVLTAYRKTFSRIQDAYFRDRMMDVEDVGRRVMEQLLGDRHVRPTLERGSVVVTDNVLPGHFARLDIDRVAAIVSEHGGPTSHGAIFARTLEIPAVTGVPGLVAAIRPGELAVVDGGEGTVFLSPDERLIAEYERARERFEIAAEHLDALRALPAETRDGRRISLTANCGLVSDLRLVEQHGAEGVGLFRTEMLAIAHRGFPKRTSRNSSTSASRRCSRRGP